MNGQDIKNTGTRKFLNRPLGKNITKTKKVIFRLPKDIEPLYKEKLKKFDLSVQESFDMIVVSGLVFRNRDIIEFIRKRVDKYKNAHKTKQIGVRKKYYECTLFMYENDHRALNEFAIEENIKLAWAYRCLFEDGLCVEDPTVMALMERSRSHNILERKKTLARLGHDKYIKVLDGSTADAILEQLTKEYDNRIFDASIQNFIESKLHLEERLKEQQEEDELDNSLAKLSKMLKQQRSQEINKLTEPIDEE